jgi:predicted O-methyltransferase YrrM
VRVSWTKGLEKELATQVRGNFAEALVMRRRLKQLLLDKVDLSQKISRGKDGYDNANWAFLQADSRGYERALHEVLELILENT